MTSKKKIRANQQNALRSTGPTSKMGRQRASQNAFKTGLYARRPLLLKGEKSEQYDQLKRDIDAMYSPGNAVEAALAQLLVDNIWHLQRQRLIEDQILRRVHYNVLRHGFASTSNENLVKFKRGITSKRDQRQRLGKDTAAESILGTFPKPQTMQTETPLEAAERLNLIQEASNTLLEANISRDSLAPMEDLAKLRERVTRQFFHNMAALEAMQERRKTIEGEPEPTTPIDENAERVTADDEEYADQEEQEHDEVEHLYSFDAVEFMREEGTTREGEARSLDPTEGEDARTEVAKAEAETEAPNDDDEDEDNEDEDDEDDEFESWT